MSDQKLVGSGQLKIGAERPGASQEPQQPMHDNSQGSLERAMSNLDGGPELGAQVNRSDERPIGTNLHSDGRVEHVQHNVVEGSTADIQTGTPVFKQILSADGSQRLIINDADMDSRVTLRNGFELTIRSALESGYVAQLADGSFIDGPNAVEGSPEKAAEDKNLDPSDAGEFLPEADEAVMKELVETTSAQDQVSVIQDITSGDGTINEHTVARAASEAGVEPAVMHGKIASVAEAMKTQASAAVAKHGVDPEAVWDWANEPANVGTLQAAVRKHAMARSTASYGDIAKSYVLAMDEHSPDAILSADLGDGIKRTYRDDHGAIVIEDANGRGYTWKSAIRSGLVKLA